MPAPLFIPPDIGPYLLLVALSAGAALVVVLGVWGFHLATAKSHVALEIEPPRPSGSTANRTFILHRFTELLGTPLGRSVMELLGQRQNERIKRRIEAAGRPDNLTVERYVRRKVGEVLIYGIGALLVYLNGAPFLALIVAAFATLTDLDLFVKGRERQDAIQSQLPDFLDVLAVTVGAGMAFRSSLERVATAMPGALSDEFRIALRQMELGTPRREAFDALRRRNRNDALNKFVTAIQQAEELGAPLSQALMEISQDMRRQDAQYLRRKAQRVNPRVTAVTAATMLPGLLILVTGALFLGTDLNLGVLLGG
ncbi:type II secretion system F family protein [Salinactinospora qingdaonensis]|uniref:DUF5936 domain-containing protein n=1 Tax=Salinactinospora qingdaonensis TaxID=702744 RepID=A0ABP7EVL8_9ACTN